MLMVPKYIFFQNYIFCSHPHGVLCFGIFGAMGTEGAGIFGAMGTEGAGIFGAMGTEGAGIFINCF